MIRRFIIAFVLLVLVVGGIVGFNIFRDRAIEQFFANMPVAPSTVSTVKAEPQPWKPGVDAIGTVSASKGVDLIVETAGIVTAINFQSNQNVNEGDVLVQLDDAIQRADLDAGRTQAALDQQSLQRAQELQRRGVSAEVTLEQAAAAASASQAQVARLEALLAQRQLRAPFSGTIGIPQIDIGQYLTSSQTVATLQDLTTMRVDFSVPEQQLTLVRIGQPVQFGQTADDMPYNGSIVGIDPKVDPTSRLASIRAEITNPDERLTPGQFVQARVELPEEPDVVSLPQTAVVTSLYGDYVYVVRPGPPPAQPSGEDVEQAQEAGASSEEAAQAAQPAQAANEQAPAQPAETTEQPQNAAAQPATGEGEAANGEAATQQPAFHVAQIFVQTGRRVGTQVEITEGVNAGDEIVTAGQNRLSNGTPVTIDNTVDPSTLGGTAEVSE